MILGSNIFSLRNCDVDRCYFLILPLNGKVKKVAPIYLRVLGLQYLSHVLKYICRAFNFENCLSCGSLPTPDYH